ncbi:MAG TPA: hypothetical protein VGH20_17255 [Myxococcales bacterium]|jgi:hypothetical protein
MSPLLAILFAAVSQTTPISAHWTERYFGVGSGEQSALACQEARGHADGNSASACQSKRGTRGGVEFTDCLCSAAGEGEHVCNVNLKVVCDGAPQSTSSIEGGGGKGGEPKGRAGRAASGRGPRVRVRPGLEAPMKLEDAWTGRRP